MEDGRLLLCVPRDISFDALKKEHRLVSPPLLTSATPIRTDTSFLLSFSHPLSSYATRRCFKRLSVNPNPLHGSQQDHRWHWQGKGIMLLLFASISLPRESNTQPPKTYSCRRRHTMTTVTCKSEHLLASCHYSWNIWGKCCPKLTLFMQVNIFFMKYKHMIFQILLILPWSQNKWLKFVLTLY